MTGNPAAVHLVPWTIPKPMGLWYQAFVLTEKGIFITSEMDATSFEELKTAVGVGVENVVSVLGDHGRNKRSRFIPLESVVGLAANEAAGTIHLKVADAATEDPMVRVPRRDQLPKIAAAVTGFVKQSRASA